VTNLWLTNDECYYHELRAIVRNFEKDEQAEELEQYVRWLIETDERTGVTGDLLATLLGRVRWHEIVEANQE